MTSFTSSDLKSLAGLLSFQEDLDSDDGYELDSTNSNYKPHLVDREIKTLRNNESIEGNQNKCLEYSTNNIWSDDEILDEEDDEAKNKKKPEYEMVYQQSVTPDDVFLQLSGKGPGSNSCECLLVKIKLPGIHSKEEVSLNISMLKLTCKTKTYYLNLDLPKEVDPVKCSAKWDHTQSILVVTLIFDTDYKLKF